MCSNNSTFISATEIPGLWWEGSVEYYLIQCFVIYSIIGTVTSFCSLTFGLVSWILIKKWRQFKNYVFMCVVVSYTTLFPLFLFRFYIPGGPYFYWVGKLIYFFVDSFACWLFLSTMMIYIDVVKVFKQNITRKLLKYNIFGWGMPVMDTISSVVADYTKLYVLVFLEENDFLMVILLLINFFIYFRVLCSLLRSPHIRRSSGRGYKFQIATFTFVMSGVFLLMAIMTVARDILMIGIIPGLLFITQTMIINVCFLMLKSNRVLWKEFCRKSPTDV